ncbi:hypothetical protein ACQP1W_09370 [Spirillospora sp. CA-255316]
MAAAPAPVVPAWLPPAPPDRAPGHDTGAPEPEDTGSRTAVLPPAAGAPVFVDASGRRARLVRRLGIFAGGALIAYLVVIGVNLAMGADVPLTPWPSGSGATRGPAGEDGKPGTRSPSGPAPAASGTVAPGAGTAAGSGPTPSGATPAPGGASPSATPAQPSRTRGKAPATPPGQTRDKPRPNG